MEFFRNKYPYTDFHEFNADWVLNKITEFDAYIKSIKEIIDQLASYYEIVDGLQDDMRALQAEVGTYSDRIAELETGIRDVRITIANLENELVRMITDEANTRKAADQYLQNQIDVIKSAVAEIAILKKYVDAVVKSLRRYIDLAISDSEYRILLYVNEKVLMLQTQIDDIYEKLRHVAVNVYNWQAYGYADDGRIDFDLNNKLLYLHLGNNLSAVEYCKLGLTADQYKAFNLTSWRYLMYGAKELHADFVFMPVSGGRQNVSVALTDVLTFLCNTLSSDAYTGLELTSDEYTALDISAAQYLRLDANLDVQHAVTYSSTGSGITADQYAHLNII